MANNKSLMPVPSKINHSSPRDRFLQKQPSQLGKPLPLTKVSSDLENPTRIQRRIPGFLAPNNNPIPLFLLFIGIKLVTSEVHTEHKGGIPTNILDSLNQVIYNPDTIDMLTAVSPYMGMTGQEGIYTIIGVLEVIHLIKGLQDKGYQMQRMQQIPVLTLDDGNKGLGVIKALQDYIPESNRPFIDIIVQALESAEKLSNNMKIYSNNIKLAGNQKPNPIENLGEIIKIVRPIIPYEHQNKIDKMLKLIQIAQVMDLDDMLKGNDTSTQPTDKTDIQYKKEDKNSPDIEQTVSNKDQNQSLEMLLKFAQLLAQSSEKKKD